MSTVAETDVIVLAGGLGTRLRSVLPDLPKPMAPIAGEPFLKYLLCSLQRQGFTRAILSLGYQADAIRDYFGAHSCGLDLVYCVEDEPLGTGGAMRAAARLASGKQVFVVNGDTFAAVDYAGMLAAHLAAGATLSLALVPVPDTARYGAVTIEAGRIRSFTEKGAAGPGYINAGVYLLERDLLDSAGLPSHFSFEQDVLRAQLSRLSPLAFVAGGYFIDIGVPEDYARAQLELPSQVAHDERCW